MKVVSYNLRKHHAAPEIQALIEQHDVDVLCLQEADTTDIPDRVAGMKLAAATSKNRLGLAVYYRENTYRLGDAVAHSLKKSVHDRLLKPAHERLLGVRLINIDSGQSVVVASFHAAPLTALNSLRRHQIKAGLDALSALGPGLPMLMVGDFNYPVFKEKLAQNIREQGHELVMSDSRTYTRYRMFTGYYDFATARGFTVDAVTTLPQGASDHLPILIHARPDLALTEAEEPEAQAS